MMRYPVGLTGTGWAGAVSGTTAAVRATIPRIERFMVAGLPNQRK
jgi:hypothetical protein